MPGQILHLAPEPREQPDAFRVQIQADPREVARQRVRRIGELEVVHHLRQTIDLQRLEPERLPHFARGAPAAIGDDVGGHRRAEPAVFLVDVLNHPLAPIAARQIQIDVRPLAALLREKPLEQQIHPDRIHRRDPEAVAHGAVGRRPPPLHEDVVLPAEIDDVPDDQEVAGEVELVDEVELAGDLRARAIGQRAIAFAGADLGNLAEERLLGIAGRDRIVGKAIPQIGHRELQTIGELPRLPNRIRPIGEQRRHVGRRLQIALRVRRQLSSRARQIGVVMDAGEHVEERPLGRRREPDQAGDGEAEHDVGARVVLLGEEARRDDAGGVAHPNDLDVGYRSFDRLLERTELVVLDGRVERDLGPLRGRRCRRHDARQGRPRRTERNFV